MAIQIHTWEEELLEPRHLNVQADVARRAQAFVRIMDILAEEGLLTSDPGRVEIREIRLDHEAGCAVIRLQSTADISPEWFLTIGHLAALLDVGYTTNMVDYVVKFRRPSWKIPPG